MPTDSEILNAIRAALGEEPPEPTGPSRKMLEAIEKGETVQMFARFFESLWEFWCTPCDKPQYLAKLAYNFIITTNHDDTLRTRFALDIPPEVLTDFKQAMIRMAQREWNFDLTKNISPHASTGGTPPISLPGG